MIPLYLESAASTFSERSAVKFGFYDQSRVESSGISVNFNAIDVKKSHYLIFSFFFKANSQSSFNHARSHHSVCNVGAHHLLGVPKMKSKRSNYSNAHEHVDRLVMPRKKEEVELEETDLRGGVYIIISLKRSQRRWNVLVTLQLLLRTLSEASEAGTRLQ